MSPALRPLGDRREAALSLLLAVQCVLLFVVVPLGASGNVVLRFAGEALLLAFGFLILALSRSRTAAAVAAVVVLISLVAAGLNLVNPTRLTGPLHHAGTVMVLALVGYVVARAVFAPGPVSTHRVLGAIVLYLNIGLSFSAFYRFVRDIAPEAFSGISADPRGLEALAALNYFSFVTLTSTGFGDIVPVHPFVRGIVNLEGVIGQLFPATLLARLVTQHLAARDS